MPSVGDGGCFSQTSITVWDARRWHLLWTMKCSRTPRFTILLYVLSTLCFLRSSFAINDLLTYLLPSLRRSVDRRWIIQSVRRCWLSHFSLYVLANHRSASKWSSPGWWLSCSPCLSCSSSSRRRTAAVLTVGSRYLAADLAGTRPSGNAKSTSVSWPATYSSCRPPSCRSAISISSEWCGREEMSKREAWPRPTDRDCTLSLHVVPGISVSTTHGTCPVGLKLTHTENVGLKWKEIGNFQNSALSFKNALNSCRYKLRGTIVIWFNNFCSHLTKLCLKQWFKNEVVS